MVDKKELNINDKDRLLAFVEKQKSKESPFSFFALINLHHLFFDKQTKDLMKNPMTITQLSELICDKRVRPDMQYLLKYLIKEEIMTQNRINPLDDRKMYFVNSKLLRKEIDSWTITKKVVQVYLDDCGIGVDLEK